MSEWLRRLFFRPMPRLRELPDIPVPAPDSKVEFACEGRNMRVAYVSHPAGGRRLVELMLDGVEIVMFMPALADKDGEMSLRLFGSAQTRKVYEGTASDLLKVLEDQDALRDRDPVRRYASGGKADARRHIVIAFQDKVLDCVCREYSITDLKGM